MKAPVIRWIARLWSLPIILMTFCLAAWSFLNFHLNIAGHPFLDVLTTPYATALAVAYVAAWHWERVGGWLALVCAVAFKVWFTIDSGHLAVGVFDLLLLGPAILFLLASRAPAPTATVAETPAQKPRRFFALPSTSLGWWSILIATGCFVFLKLFWMQAGRQGRDRSTFFSDPINAGCLIGMLGMPIIAMILAIVAMIWKRERSLFLIPVILLGLFALPWVIAALGGGNP